MKSPPITILPSGCRATGRKKCRKRKRKIEEFEAYILAIEDWEWSYGFGINQTTYREGPYSDYRHLHLIGRLIAPARIKAEVAVVILMLEADLADRRYEEPPKSVGSRKKIPTFTTDCDAEHFVGTADLSKYDLTDGSPRQFHVQLTRRPFAELTKGWPTERRRCVKLRTDAMLKELDDSSARTDKDDNPAKDSGEPNDS